MKKPFVTALSLAVVVLLSPALASACPAVVARAKSMVDKSLAAHSDEIQPSRSLAGARPDVSQMAPRQNQDVQAPRDNQNVQAPRENQNIQAPVENQDVQAPRSALTKASSLVRAAEVACKAGNMPLASSNAQAAIELLR